MDQATRIGKRKNRKPVFSKLDHWIVTQGMRSLPLLERFVVELRFWHHFSIQEIADLTAMTSDAVEAVLDKAYGLLKAYCVKRPDFSRADGVRLAA